MRYYLIYTTVTVVIQNYNITEYINVASCMDMHVKSIHMTVTSIACTDTGTKNAAI